MKNIVEMESGKVLGPSKERLMCEYTLFRVDKPYVNWWKGWVGFCGGKVGSGLVVERLGRVW